jgi:hypothetical protein
MVEDPIDADETASAELGPALGARGLPSRA